MKNKIILLLIIFFSAGIYSVNAQSKQQLMLQKWKDEMEQRKKHREEILAKEQQQERQLQYEKKPEQIITPVQQQPQIRPDVQQNPQPITPVRKEDSQPIDSRKFKPVNKNIKKEEIN